jgi:hypothetical protein
MKVTLNLPDVTPELLDLSVSYFGEASRAEFLRGVIMEMLEVVQEDAIPGPDGECIGSGSTNERELFPRERNYLRAPEPGEEWKDGEPEAE